MTKAVSIVPIPCRRDNYAYAVFDDGGKSAWIVDPSLEEPVLAFLHERNLLLAGIILTHHHPDHVDGVPGLLANARWRGEPVVIAHTYDRERIAGLTRTVDAPLGHFVATDLACEGLTWQAMHVPGHTLGAVAWKLGDDVFTGDTLFSAGCGRLFEGSPPQLHDSLQNICKLEKNTRLWFGHEYTRGILQWALRHFPHESAIAQALAALEQAGQAGQPEVTTPTTVAREWDINLFVRAADAAAFAELRALKDKG